MSRKQKQLLTLFVVVVLTLAVWWAQGHLDSYQLRILNLSAVNVILAVSLNLIFGFTGQFSLGHAGFMAIGAYTTALLIMPPMQKEMIFLLEPLVWPFSVLQLPFLLALLAGGLVAALFAVAVGFPILRLRGDYLGIATLGFAEIVRVVANNVPPITNGALGLKGIPEIANLWWTFGWMVFTLFVIKRLLDSSFGRALMAIRENEIAAEAMGVKLAYYKTLSFAISAFFAGVGGGLLGSLITTIDPKTFSFFLTFNVLIMVVVGGLGSLTGSVIAGFILTVLMEVLRPIEAPMVIGSLHIPGIPGMRMVLFSLVLLVTILFLQKGLFGQLEADWDTLSALGGKIRNWRKIPEKGGDVGRGTP